MLLLYSGECSTRFLMRLLMVHPKLDGTVETVAVGVGCGRGHSGGLLLLFLFTNPASNRLCVVCVVGKRSPTLLPDASILIYS